MKKRIFIPVILLIVIASAFTQVKPPVKKVYGYKQPSIPGILPDFSEENSKPKQILNYWVYLELPKTEKINVTGLWISGIHYELKTDTITELPVRKVIFNGTQTNDTTIMVPATKNKIILVYPSGESKIDDSKKALNLARLNELVIRYVWKNNVYYSTMTKLKELDPDVRL